MCFYKRFIKPFIFLHKDTAFYNSGSPFQGQIINSRKPLIMGVLNVTPDSFFAGSRAEDDDILLMKASAMLEQGADILDVGACSTRPGSLPPSESQERQGLTHALQVLKTHFPAVLLSADTYRASVAEAAILAGASIINDVSGGTLDPVMFDLIAKSKATYVLMHIQGTPQSMQIKPQYGNVCNEVLAYFKERIHILKKQEVSDIIIDPGFGFGKTIEHNYQLLSHLELFHQLDLPILCGFSRKGMVHNVLGTDADHALNGTTVLNTIAALKGAAILRVHDVREAAEVRTLLAVMHKARVES